MLSKIKQLLQHNIHLLKKGRSQVGISCHTIVTVVCHCNAVKHRIMVQLLYNTMCVCTV